MSQRASAVVLVSGRGSNMQALLDAAADRSLPIEFRAVISNQPSAPALERARAAGLDAVPLDHRAFDTRAAFDDALSEVIDRYQPDLIVMAGFMRILTDAFIHRYADRMINIHPSLLPKYPGLDTHARAIEAGDHVHGATVHYVTATLDAGPAILQAEVPVLADDDPERLAARVLIEEHRIYPLALRWIAEGRVQYDGTQVWLDGKPLHEPVVLRS